MYAHYFGRSQQPLLGVHHPPRKGTSRNHAVLICSPIAHEHLRTHWALRLLAQQLSRDGFDVMRFDYTGIGDSYASISEVVSLQRWIDDVHLAAEDLFAESGCSQLSVVGLRFGATLAALASRDHLPVDRLVMWEPVLDGQRYIEQLRHMQQRMLDLWVVPTTTRNDNDGEEILGFDYPRSLLNEILAIDVESLRPNCHCLTIVDGQTDSLADVASSLADRSAVQLTTRSADQHTARSVVPSGQPLQETNFVATVDRSDWDDLRQIETAWLPAKSQAAVIDAIKEVELSHSQIDFVGANA